MYTYMMKALKVYVPQSLGESHPVPAQALPTYKNIHKSSKGSSSETNPNLGEAVQCLVRHTYTIPVQKAELPRELSLPTLVACAHGQ